MVVLFPGLTGEVLSSPRKLVLLLLFSFEADTLEVKTRITKRAKTLNANVNRTIAMMKCIGKIKYAVINFLKVALKEQQDMVDKIFLVEATTTHKAVSSFNCDLCNHNIAICISTICNIAASHAEASPKLIFIN